MAAKAGLVRCAVPMTGVAGLAVLQGILDQDLRQRLCRASDADTSPIQ